MFRFPPNSDCIGVDYCNTDIKYSCQRSLFYPKENYKQDLYYLLSICKSQHTMFQRLNPVCGDPLNLEKTHHFTIFRGFHFLDFGKEILKAKYSAQ